MTHAHALAAACGTASAISVPPEISRSGLVVRHAFPLEFIVSRRGEGVLLKIDTG